MGEPTRGTPEKGREIENLEAGRNARRRLLKGGLAAGPVVLTLPGQSALAQTACAAPSAIASGNMSAAQAQAPCGTGFSPGYWKVCQHLGQWSAAGLTAPTFAPLCTNGVPKTAPVTEGTLFGQILPFANSGALAAIGAWRILAYPSDVDKSLAAFNMTQVQLARHLIASYLNLRKVPSFQLTLGQLRSMWEQGSIGAYCPSSSCTLPAQLWSAQQVVCYLRNYTMDAASVSADPIPWVC